MTRRIFAAIAAVSLGIFALMMIFMKMSGICINYNTIIPFNTIMTKGILFDSHNLILVLKI